MAPPGACLRYLCPNDLAAVSRRSRKVQARYSNGVLEIELERLEADRPKKIQIRAA